MGLGLIADFAGRRYNLASRAEFLPLGETRAQIDGGILSKVQKHVGSDEQGLTSDRYVPPQSNDKHLCGGSGAS
ncbi:hypothetical protein J2R76_003651 [Bradyrhizobium sp. USDA 4532]|nr:hypothetical protein [Bradyrhizobium sp. USDA 4545]MCP1920060.1 hypothetical protein [Bradyrhizobium sp. USDA 4532]